MQSAANVQSIFDTLINPLPLKKRSDVCDIISAYLRDRSMDDFYKGFIFLYAVLKRYARGKLRNPGHCQGNKGDELLVDDWDETAFLKALKVSNLEWFMVITGRTLVRSTTEERHYQNVVKITSRNRPVLFLNIGQGAGIGQWISNIRRSMLEGRYLTNAKSRSVVFKDRRKVAGMDVPKYGGKFMLSFEDLDNIYTEYQRNVYIGIQTNNWSKVTWERKNFMEIGEGTALTAPLKAVDIDNDDTDVEDIENIIEENRVMQAYFLSLS